MKQGHILKTSIYLAIKMEGIQKRFVKKINYKLKVNKLKYYVDRMPGIYNKNVLPFLNLKKVTNVQWQCKMTWAVSLLN